MEAREGRRLSSDSVLHHYMGADLGMDGGYC